MEKASYIKAKVPAKAVPEVRHHAVGLRCWIGDTTHPVARQHYQKPCTIIAAWRFGPILMLSIALDDGSIINGLFLYELNDAEGRSLRYKDWLKER